MDDPTWYGRISAANSISDIYAMGGEPVCAVCVFALPKDVPEDAPAAILNGAVETCTEAGVALVGGHTVKDQEVKFGLAVTGTVHPDRVVSNAGAKPGDVIVLTKPVGSGFLTTAMRAEMLDDDTALAAQEVMAQLNRGAGEAMVDVGVHAATDVTGFGLLGHLAEMAEGSDTTIRLDVRRVPWMKGLDRYLDKRFMCGGLHRNREYADDEGRVRWSGGDEAQHWAVTDPQTSGGLLIAVAPERLDALLAAMEERGVGTRAVIGEVLAHDGPRVEVV